MSVLGNKLDAKFSCNIFQQDAATCIDTYCSLLIVNRTAIVAQKTWTQLQEAVENEYNSCVENMSTTVEQYRHAILMNYDYTKEFNFIRMGIWHYKNITWLRHSAYSLGKSRAIELVELCEVLQHRREEEVPIDVWHMAVDFPAHGRRPRCVIGHHLIIVTMIAVVLVGYCVTQMQRHYATS